MLEQYDYRFPEELIALQPAHPRDGARLLAYRRDTGDVAFDTFKNIAAYLPKNAVLVFNETKVIPARVTLQKDTGGAVTILYLETAGGLVKAMADKKVGVGSNLFNSGKKVFEVASQEEKYFFLKPLFPLKQLIPFFEKYGVAPLPPYIKHSPLSRNAAKKEYQTVFATTYGSVAAPTASLHFTKPLLTRLKRAGIKIEFVTLHVNLGTFAPLTEEQLQAGKLHGEYFEIKPAALKRLNGYKKEGRPIIAVGTTVMRTLESASAADGTLQTAAGLTDIFIREGYRFKFVDGLITNFHVPKSSLLMLVAAFAGREKTLELYRKAIEEKFRLFSFGDGMLLI